jgi:hypothetical protein
MKNTDISVIDFCSGAGGPTPTIERIINTSRQDHDQPPIPFKLSDIRPHLESWTKAAKQSPNLTFIRSPVDAANPPAAAISSANGSRVFRLFALSFHHLPNDLAASVLSSTLESSHGFCILELQDRRLASLALMGGHFFLVLLTSWLWYWRDPVQMLLTYGVPVLPFLMAFDGTVSALRTREFEEVVALIGDGDGGWTVNMIKGEKRAKVSRGNEVWTLTGGRRMHTWPIGYANWVVGIREGDEDDESNHGTKESLKNNDGD